LQHEVFWLDVSVRDVVLMQVAERGEELLHNHGCLTLSEVFAVEDKVE
jgi:hypothetical protein